MWWRNYYNWYKVQDPIASKPYSWLLMPKKWLWYLGIVFFESIEAIYLSQCMRLLGETLCCLSSGLSMTTLSSMCSCWTTEYSRRLDNSSKDHRHGLTVNILHSSQVSWCLAKLWLESGQQKITVEARWSQMQVLGVRCLHLMLKITPCVRSREHNTSRNPGPGVGTTITILAAEEGEGMGNDALELKNWQPLNHPVQAWT